MHVKRIFLIFIFYIFTLTVFSGSDDVNLNENQESEPESIINLDLNIKDAIQETKIDNINNSQIQISKDNKKDEAATDNVKSENKDKDFYSIQSLGTAACLGKLWMFEEFDSDCNVISSVVYNADKPVEKRKYTYKKGIKDTAEIFLDDKIIKIQFTSKGLEAEKKVYIKNDEEPVETTINVYNEKNQIIETTFITNEKTYLQKFVYNEKGEKKQQTSFLNNEKISFIEFKKDKQIIHLFEEGKEIKMWEEKN